MTHLFSCRSVHVEKCSRCVIVLGAASSTVEVTNCDSLTVIHSLSQAAHQVRTYIWCSHGNQAAHQVHAYIWCSHGNQAAHQVHTYGVVMVTRLHIRYIHTYGVVMVTGS